MKIVAQYVTAAAAAAVEEPPWGGHEPRDWANTGSLSSEAHLKWHRRDGRVGIDCGASIRVLDSTCREEVWRGGGGGGGLVRHECESAFFGDLQPDANRSSSLFCAFFTKEDDALLFAAKKDWMCGVPFAHRAAVGGSIEPRCCRIESV